MDSCQAVGFAQLYPTGPGSDEVQASWCLAPIISCLASVTSVLATVASSSSTPLKKNSLSTRAWSQSAEHAAGPLPGRISNSQHPYIFGDRHHTPTSGVKFVAAPPVMATAKRSTSQMRAAAAGKTRSGTWPQKFEASSLRGSQRCTTVMSGGVPSKRTPGRQGSGGGGGKLPSTGPPNVGAPGGGGGGGGEGQELAKGGGGVTVLTKEKVKVEDGLAEEVKEDLEDEGWWRVLLHNDEIHTFEYVTEAIVKVMPHITRKKAFTITRHTHQNGVATITVVWKKLAEQMCMGLQTFGLTVSIAPDDQFENSKNSQAGDSKPFA